MLNFGYGSQESHMHQSIGVLDLKTSRLADYPDARLSDTAHQSYFLGLAFSSDGKHLYASIGSLTDPTGEKSGNTGNAIAVYRFALGKVTPERLIHLAPQPLAAGKTVATGVKKTALNTAIPYPAGLTVISAGGSDRLLIANNLSDNVVLLDPVTGKVLQRFDLSTNDLVPSSFPYTVVATRDGKRAWCSLWNASQVAELDLVKGTVARWIKVLAPQDPLAPGSHPTAMILSPDEKVLYVALSNADIVAALWTKGGEGIRPLSTQMSGQKYSGAYPTALAQSPDGKYLFVADSSLDAVAVFEPRPVQHVGRRPRPGPPRTAQPAPATRTARSKPPPSRPRTASVRTGSSASASAAASAGPAAPARSATCSFRRVSSRRR